MIVEVDNFIISNGRAKFLAANPIGKVKCLNLTFVFACYTQHLGIVFDRVVPRFVALRATSQSKTF